MPQLGNQAAHKETHQDGGSDEIDLTGLEGAAGLDQAPVNGEIAKGIASNWAYDHAANAAAHHEKTALDDSPVDGQTAEGITSNWAYDHAANKDAHHAVFVNRGDPAAYDDPAGGWLFDGGWYDFDLSSIVQAGAIAVLMRVSIYATAVNHQISFRKNGNENEVSISKIISKIADAAESMDVVVPLDSSGKIEYLSGNATLTVYAVVKGWWI